jgi:uncharacterized protein YgbK (DUF1537 family)
MISALAKSGSSPKALPESFSHERSGAKTLPYAILLADDLTGACDSGIAFVKAGHEVSVGFSAASPEDVAGAADVIALSVETRNLSPEDAEICLNQLGNLSRFAGSLLFKKVDSAGRGNPGAEILAILRLSACDGVVYAPAFPSAGRTIKNGILRVQDVSGQDVEVDLVSLIPASARSRVMPIPVESEAHLRQTLLRAHRDGKDIWLCDSMEQEDLQRIARVASELPLHLLWAGSAGLAEAIAELTGAAHASDAARATAASASGCTLLFSGTTHSVTLMQLKQLASSTLPIVPGSDASLLPSSCGIVQLVWDEETGESNRKFIQELWRHHRQPGRPMIDSLVLTGGDTAAFVLKALGATSLRLRGEIEPGIPWGVVDDGLAQGCAVITKSGGFGVESSLNNAIEFCKRLRL